jgi:hypothetical protein
MFRRFFRFCPDAPVTIRMVRNKMINVFGMHFIRNAVQKGAIFTVGDSIPCVYRNYIKEDKPNAVIVFFTLI